MKTVMNHQFSQIPDVRVQRSAFNRSHGYKTTFNVGQLVPVFLDEALPGDTFNCKMTSFARMATPLHPIMDNMKLDSFFFAVPYRLVWDNFQRFMGEQTSPGASVDFLIPQMAPPTGGYLEGSLSDYFGIPTKVEGFKHSALWHRAYNLIWNTWFRDQNLQDPVVVDTDDADSDPADYEILRRGKRHDYFTSCLPWPQKENDLFPDGVTLPLGVSAPVVGDGTKFYLHNDADATDREVKTDTNAQVVLGSTPSSIGSARWGQTGLEADLTNATSATINALRQAFQIQRLLERDARGGTRYIELVRSHFGVTSPDARLQRPEYLGGGSSSVNISPIPQTSASGATGTTSKQGDLAAMATISGQHGFTKSFTEHTLVIGMVSVRADLTYQQGLNRMFSRQTRWDLFWPSLANLGEQAVLNKEIFMSGTALDDEDVFGYQERYAEYRYKPSQITGLFRSNATGSLDIWHLSQEFADTPVLGDDFIQELPPMERILAVPSQPHFIYDSYIDLNCVRPMPVYSVPGMIDHF